MIVVLCSCTELEVAGYNNSVDACVHVLKRAASVHHIQKINILKHDGHIKIHSYIVTYLQMQMMCEAGLATCLALRCSTCN